MENILEKIDNRSSNICVIGLGYTGLPLLMAFSNAGFDVYGLDNNTNKLEILQSGRSTISLIPDSEIKKLVCKENVTLLSTDMFSATQHARECDFIICCVPTPVYNNMKPNLEPLCKVRDFMKGVQGDKNTGNKYFILESTTFPGCTQQLFGDVEKLSLMFSPERIDPGNTEFTLENTPKIIGGVDSYIGQKLYETIISAPIIKVSTTTSAEMTKLIENIYRFVNISLSNEMATICGKLQIDYKEALEAASTKPFGFSKFTPTYKIGGECIGVDPYYFKEFANDCGMRTKILDACTEVNEERINLLFDHIKWILDSAGKTIRDTTFGFIGVSYKKGIDDCRNSIASELYPLLLSLGATVYYHDPYVKIFENIFSIDLSEVCKRCDVAIILTDHSEVDYKYIKENVDIIIDTKNIYNDPFVYTL